MNNIQGKVVIITGASSGIGEATAYKLAEQGAKIVLAARREAQLKAIADNIKAKGGEAVYRVTDVVKPEDNQALVELAKSAFGKVDAIFLNAGLMPSAPLSALETDNWNRMIDVNIKGVLNGIAAVLPTFEAQKSGHVLATSSVAGLKVYPGGTVYCGTKWAVKAIMEGLRMESAQAGTNIRTATIYPAAVQSELVAGITDDATSQGYRQLYDTYEIPAERVANVVAFALSQPDDTNVSEFTIGPTTQPW
ncbi:SDR family oxidoreductase [Basfia succiniciproducens]|uniref:NADP-dependent 3-hydroxy acid dehydrogenase YdfG n=1 Tax=Basfia succiniciproducens TaxID=653940 RepID=A0A1G5EF47_9PAST|nr:SDR family oxidoreductase [Basfia succiniciproducens]QIM69309.1 oxidoreductase [Basfia succiniciproducens]SCY25576.1 NADP-dependent 3-hydroxy acid dehydrogenase YdfG [Basfia succiniciproducens]SEQ68015.1 NADP-dependent 3-hydroxy acid dehydrogenase YdfG [Basfia succiniciproducens]